MKAKLDGVPTSKGSVPGAGPPSGRGGLGGGGKPPGLGGDDGAVASGSGSALLKKFSSGLRAQGQKEAAPGTEKTALQQLFSSQLLAARK